MLHDATRGWVALVDADGAPRGLPAQAEFADEVEATWDGRRAELGPVSRRPVARWGLAGWR